MRETEKMIILWNFPIEALGKLTVGGKSPLGTRKSGLEYYVEGRLKQSVL